MESKTEIRISLNSMTPEQAFMFGRSIPEGVEFEWEISIEQQDKVEQNEPQTAATKKYRKPRSRYSQSTKWKYNTKAPREIIALCVQARFEGAKLQDIANTLNNEGWPSVSGKPWSDASVWSVTYSKQAKSAWKIMEDYQNAAR